MRKNFSLAALMLAVSFVVFGGFVFSSCSDQKYSEPEPQVVEKITTQYVSGPEIERIIGNTLIAQTKQDCLEILFNGKLAMKTSVSPDSLTLTLPIAQHTASTIDGADNHWRDSHGMGFIGTKNQTQLDGLTLDADIMPANPFSTIKKIHKYVTMLDGEFNLVGMATLDATGEAESFSIPVPTGRYFMCDTTVEVRTITETEYQVVYRDTTEYIRIDKDLVIVSAFGYGTIDFTYGDKSFNFRMDLDSINIHRSENEWGVAKKSSENTKGFNLSDLQAGHYTIRENGIRLESVNFVGESASFMKINDIFKYGTATVKVVVSYTDKNGTAQTREFQVSGSYFHELKAGATPAVIVPDVTTDHTYTVDSTRTAVKDSEGNLIGEKMRVTIKRDGEVVFKGQYMAKEWGLMTATLTGTQVGDNNQLRATEVTPEAYNQDGWSGTEDLKGATLTATAKQFKMRTYFKAVPGFGQSEESVAESNIVFGTRNFYWKDAETDWSLTITEGEMKVKVIEDVVTFNEAAKTEVNNRGLQYEYIGSHNLRIEQFVGTKSVNTQFREEYLLYPKN